MTSVDGEGVVALARIEMTSIPGTGKLKIGGDPGRNLRQAMQTAFDYARANQMSLGLQPQLSQADVHVQVVDLMKSENAEGFSVGLLVALCSLFRNQPTLSGLVVIGDMTIQGNVLPVLSLHEPLRVAMDNGARRALLPLTSRRQLMDVPPDVIEPVDQAFYSDPLTAVVKAVGLGYILHRWRHCSTERPAFLVQRHRRSSGAEGVSSGLQSQLARVGARPKASEA